MSNWDYGVDMADWLVSPHGHLPPKAPQTAFLPTHTHIDTYANITHFNICICLDTRTLAHTFQTQHKWESHTHTQPGGRINTLLIRSIDGGAWWTTEASVSKVNQTASCPSATSHLASRLFSLLLFTAWASSLPTCGPGQSRLHHHHRWWWWMGISSFPTSNGRAVHHGGNARAVLGFQARIRTSLDLSRLVTRHMAGPNPLIPCPKSFQPPYI